MALKAVHVSDVPNLDQVTENASVVALYANRFSNKGFEVGRSSFKVPKFLVIGHRGNGMNKLQSSDRRLQAFKENSIASFNAAASFPVDFIEFDVQVTKDGVPIIFHDNFILSEEHNGTISERRVTDLTLSEFMSYGPQSNPTKQTNKPLLRKTKEGNILPWKVETDDSHCTLESAFKNVNTNLGFNIELKFDDNYHYTTTHLTNTLNSILNIVTSHANNRQILFSSFHPDAALLVKKLQCENTSSSSYPVFFLTNGGTEMYSDVRRNGLEEAIRVCVEGGLEGIVSEVKGVFRNPTAVNKIKEAKLSLLTYGQLNNVAEAVYMQYVMGIDGVIVDLVKEITEAVCTYNLSNKIPEEQEDEASTANTRPQFSEREVSFLLKLIPQLIQQ